MATMPGVEAPELGEEVGPHQDAAARGDEDVAHGVVLAVIDLAGLDAVDHGARLVAAHARRAAARSGRPS